MSQLCAVYLDRDGTIIDDTHYPKEPDKINLLPQAAEGLKLMNQKGYSLFVISNQSGLTRNLISDEQFLAVHLKCCELLQNEGVEIEQFAYCFHHPDDQCRCRKPQAGLVPTQHKGKRINVQSSFVVGDKITDLRLGETIGAKAYLVLTGKGKATESKLKEKGQGEKYPAHANLLEIAESLPPLTPA